MQRQCPLGVATGCPVLLMAGWVSIPNLRGSGEGAVVRIGDILSISSCFCACLSISKHLKRVCSGQGSILALVGNTKNHRANTVHLQRIYGLVGETRYLKKTTYNTRLDVVSASEFIGS